jgi:hypothetical protein
MYSPLSPLSANAKRGLNILYINKFPPLYEVERGKYKGGEYMR